MAIEYFIVQRKIRRDQCRFFRYQTLLDKIRDMNSRDTTFVDRYFSVNRILLLIVGLWPYRQTRLVRLQVILMHGILISGIVFQFTMLITAKCTINFIVKILSTILPFLGCVIMYNSFWINSKYIRYLLDQLQYTYDHLKDENEMYIIEKYGYNAKRNMNIIIQLSTFCLVCSVVFTWIGEIILPSKQFRSHRIKQISDHFEYFIDEEKYFNFILIHINVLLCSGMIAILAIGLIIIVCVRHFCGIFRIASYRIKQTMTNKLLNDVSQLGEVVIRKRIIYAIDIQRKAMWLYTYFITIFEDVYLIMIVITVACLSMNFFQIFHLMSLESDTEQLILHVSCTTLIFLYLYIICANGQEITDHCNHVFSTAYNLHWYRAPLRIQKLIILLIQRSNKAFNVYVGGLFLPSLEFFSMIISTSVSYFTVIYSSAK